MKITFGNLTLTACFCLYLLSGSQMFVYFPFLFISFLGIFVCCYEINYLRIMAEQQMLKSSQLKSFIEKMNMMMRPTSNILLFINGILLYQLYDHKFYLVFTVFLIATYVKMYHDVIFDKVKTSPQYLNLKAAIEKL